MSIISKKIVILVCVISILGAIQQPFKAQAAALEVFLKYDSKTQRLDFDVSNPQKVAPNASLPDPTGNMLSETSGGLFTLSLFKENQKFISFPFTPEHDGTFTFVIPDYYFTDSLKIYKNSTQQEILTTNISSLKQCFSNNICEYEKGENIYTCAGDCAKDTAQYSPQTQEVLKTNNGIVKDESGDILLNAQVDQTPIIQPEESIQPNQKSPPIALLIAGISIIVAALSFLLYNKFIKKRAG